MNPKFVRFDYCQVNSIGRILHGVFAVLVTLQSFAADPATQVKEVNPALRPIVEVKDLPHVLLIGDSISIGYTLPVRSLLEGKANLHRIPTNGGPTTNGLANLDGWLGDRHWDVIHFNWGLHDLKVMPDGAYMVSPEDYERNLERLVGRLKQTGASLVWASTTPVPQGKLSPLRKPADAGKYNAIAKRVMEKNGIEIDDLFSFALPRLKTIQRPANVHFTKEGSAQLAERVAECITENLPKR